MGEIKVPLAFVQLVPGPKERLDPALPAGDSSMSLLAQYNIHGEYLYWSSTLRWDLNAAIQTN